MLNPNKVFPFYRCRFSVKPGITSWAQVRGDYAGSVESQLRNLEYEIFYIQNRSMFFDLFIVCRKPDALLRVTHATIKALTCF
ncbi:MAG: sugar transferase [Deltaproteobacteria bacterium]|nr:sugar transferase [Deltaproteobacteria bacterium]